MALSAKLQSTGMAITLAVSILLGGVWAQEALANPSSHPRQLYNHVMHEFRDKDYAAALAGFHFFLELYGSSRLATNAQFWKGECEFRLKRYREALVSYEKVLEQRPATSKVAGATVKMGLIYGYLRQREEARILLERVLVNYPESREAKIAQNAITRWDLWDDEPEETSPDADSQAGPITVEHQPADYQSTIVP